MVLLRLFISFFPLFLFASSIYLDVNLYSDKLYFDTFSSKWKSIPSNEPLNRALNFSKAGVYLDSIGIKYESDGVLKVNRGFIETWFYAQNDFNTLLKKSDINYYITTPSIYGKLNYAEYVAYYMKKDFLGNTIIFNLLRGKKLDYIKVKGSNSKDRFVADLMFIYNKKNFIAHNFNDSNSSAYGVGIDIERDFVLNKVKGFIGVYNLIGFLKWSNVNYMYYHFDSNTKYIGKDGYIHYRAFGNGVYKVGYDFYQKLPLFIKGKLIYYFNKFNIGWEGLYSEGIYFNEGYGVYKVKYKYFPNLKLGYVFESKSVVYGLLSKNFMLEFGHNTNFHSRFLRLSFKVNY